MEASSVDSISEVLVRFQEGYTKRDVASVDAYVEELFTMDAIVIGTGVDEWCNGIDDVKHLVESDWAEWGDLRIDIGRAVVTTGGDNAWIAVPGTVATELEYPIRVAAGLTRESGSWKFKQMVFSYPHPREPIE